MTDRIDRDWTPAEQAALRDLASSPPPGDLEDAVVSQLARQGLVRPEPRRRWLVPALVPTAAVLLIVAVWMVGTRDRAGPVPGGEGRFMLLLYEGPSFTPGEGGGAIEYARWADSLGQAGIAVEGEELAAEGATLGADPADEPGALGRLGGYMIVNAPDLDAALALARTHPHLRHGGAIVVRPIVEH